MPHHQLLSLLQRIDIYLLDQILKGRFSLNDEILDAGCGDGRNIAWLVKHGYKVTVMDKSPEALEQLVKNTMLPKSKAFATTIEEMPFDKEQFDKIICSAVLHFAEGHEHFHQMFYSLIRVLKTGGMIFIRMTSDIGIEDKVKNLGCGVFHLPDNTDRYLLTRTGFIELLQKYKLMLVEPLKTVNVNDKRCMSTLMLKKL